MDDQVPKPPEYIEHHPDCEWSRCPGDCWPGYDKTFEGRVEKFRRAWHAVGESIGDAIQRAIDTVLRP